ncbi:MAG: hypothetical protein RJA44_1895 [Pseudomonadota bacterium]|jgi:hypothetical protein
MQLGFRNLLAALGLAASLAVPALCHAAFEFSGTRALVAVTADGQRLPIGTVQFTPAEAGRASFKVALQTELFTDYFLSMREFKCLPAAKEISCHVPYPYPHPAKVDAADLSWLEHNLLFLHKSPAEFGAKLWNGIYFEFAERGDALVGVPRAIDLNDISAPPGDLAKPPYDRKRRHDMPAEARWIRELVIE